MKAVSFRLLWMLTGLLLAAFALRLIALGDAAVWWDEAWSAWVAQQPLAETTRLTAADVHPPLYQWALHLWVRLTGISPFAIRYLSLLWSLLTVALIYALARRMRGPRAGLIAALLAAGSVFLVHWAQETRMYAQAAFFTALAGYAYLRVMVQRDGGPVSWALLVIGCAAAALSHYLGLFVIAILNLHWLLTLRARPRGLHLRWVAAMAVTGLPLLAWALYALALTRSGSVGGDFSPLFVFQLAAALWTAGTSVDVTDYTALSLALLLPVAAGLLLYTRRPDPALLVWLMALAPPLIILILSVLETRFYSPRPEERYYVVFAPLVFAGFGLAIDALMRWRRLAGWVLLLALVGVYGWAYLRDVSARYTRDDYATLFAAVHTLAASDEPVLFVSDDRYPLPFYHLNRAAGWQTSLQVAGLPAPRDGVVDEAALRSLVGEAGRVWVVRIEQHLTDPDRLLTDWFEAHYTPVYRETIDYNGFTLYAAPDGDLSMPASGAVLPPPVGEYRPGDVIRAGAADARFVLRHGGDVIAEQTTIGWGLAQFPVYPAYPNGNYTLSIDGEDYPLRVTQAQPPIGSPAQSLDAGFGPLALTGVTVEDGEARPGESLRVRLYWRVDAQTDTDYTVFAQLLGPFRETGPVWANDDRYPADTPTTALWPSLIFSEVRTLTVPPDMPPGTYEAAFGLYDLATGERLTTSDGRDAVTVGGLQVR